ncbi:MAG: tripartite tricarboxylate transporter TctB family protein [Planctomycetota bacterium]|jgi:hypothetical protein|nr:tripartite tricarboxylate transporter TctB family protein [Planctomycetota bacterium]
MRKWTIVALIMLAAFGVVCMLDVEESSFMVVSDDLLGATGFPRIVGGLLALSSAIVLAQTFLDLKRKGEEPISGKIDFRTGLAMILAVAYVLGVIHLGFAISTFFFLLFLTLVFDNLKLTHIKGILAYSAGLTLVAHYFFKVFKVYLPDTILF